MQPQTHNCVSSFTTFIFLPSENVINQLISEMPLTCIVWSHILRRLYWRHAVCRINSFVASFVLKSGGASIKYPDVRVAK